MHAGDDLPAIPIVPVMCTAMYFAADWNVVFTSTGLHVPPHCVAPETRSGAYANIQFNSVYTTTPMLREMITSSCLRHIITICAKQHSSTVVIYPLPGAPPRSRHFRRNWCRLTASNASRCLQYIVRVQPPPCMPCTPCPPCLFPSSSKRIGMHLSH